MNLVIDQGNTRFKAALFENKQLKVMTVFREDEIAEFISWVESNVNDSLNVIVSSVVNSALNLSQLKINKIIYLNEKTELPITNRYKTPETLGDDRLANACASWLLAKNKNSLVIDLGTCIKYDLVDAKGVYLGGNISPGLQMRFKSLNQLTDKLPLLNFKVLKQEYGNDTNSSILCGVQLGICNEIKGFIDRYSRLYKGLTIFMTGGDAKYFDKSFKNDIFAVSNLTLIGLNEILLHNE